MQIYMTLGDVLLKFKLYCDVLLKFKLYLVQRGFPNHLQLIIELIFTFCKITFHPNLIYI